MATDTTTFTPDALIQPWEGLDDALRLGSEVPRAEIIFQVIDGEILGPGVGDDSLMLIDCELPRNYAYTFAECGIRIIQDTPGEANTWDSVGELSFFNVALSGVTRTRNVFTELASNGNHFDLQGIAQSKVYCPVCPSSFTWVPLPNTNVSVVAAIANATDDSDTSLVTMLMRFWAYDIHQANHWQVNTPQLVRS